MDSIGFASHNTPLVVSYAGEEPGDSSGRAAPHGVQPLSLEGAVINSQTPIVSVETMADLAILVRQLAPLNIL